MLASNQKLSIMKKSMTSWQSGGLKKSWIGLLIAIGFVGLAKLLLTFSLKDLHLETHPSTSSDAADIGEGFGLE